MTRADNWGNETATAREKEIAEEEERRNKEAKCKVYSSIIDYGSCMDGWMIFLFHPKVADLKKRLKTKATAAATSTSATGEAAESGLKTGSPSTSTEPVVE